MIGLCEFISVILPARILCVVHGVSREWTSRMSGHEEFGDVAGVPGVFSCADGVGSWNLQLSA